MQPIIITPAELLKICLVVSFQKPEVEGHELVIPSLKEEEENYIRYSDNYDAPTDMENSEKTQRSQKGKTPKAKPPLPSMDELRDLAKRLQDAMDASTIARKGQKVIHGHRLRLQLEKHLDKKTYLFTLTLAEKNGVGLPRQRSALRR